MWINPKVERNTTNDNIFGVQLEWVDEPEAEFTQADPFRYADGRVNNTQQGRDSFKAAAEAAREAERARRAFLATKQAQLLEFMNG